MESTTNITSINTGEDASAVALLEFIVQGVGITTIALFGIIGNLLSIVILTRSQLKSSITWFLLSLTIFDTIFLVLNILIYSLISTFTFLDVAESYRNAVNPVDFPILLYINDTAQTASVYFTLAIALERYFVIGWPLVSRSYCTYERCRLYSIGVFAFACIYQFIRFAFPAERVSIDEGILIKNCPHLLPMNGTEGEIGADDDYEQYFFRWPYMTFMMILPSVVLIILNSLIWKSLREGKKKRQILTSPSKKRDDKELSIAVMLFGVVVVFLACQSMFYIMAYLEAFQQCTWESVKFYLIPVDLLLITINSSVNFLIYCMFGSRFREQFWIFMKSSFRRVTGQTIISVSESIEKTRSTKGDSSTAV